MKKEKTKTAYRITVNYTSKKTSHRQFILPNEMWLIKTWLNQENEYAADSLLIEKVELTMAQYKNIFI